MLFSLFGIGCLTHQGGAILLLRVNSNDISQALFCGDDFCVVANRDTETNFNLTMIMLAE